MRLDIESLRAFLQIAQQGGVTRAADALCLTQSAVSHKIKRLEQRIGQVLFHRREGRLSLTTEGQKLYFYAKRILALHDEAVANLSASDICGQVSLGATENFALVGLADFLHSFSQGNPGASVNIQIEQSQILQTWLQQQKIDIGLLQITLEQQQPGDIELWQEELVWISAPDRDWHSNSCIPLITFGPNCFYKPLIGSALNQAGIQHHTVLECPSHQGVFNAVASGLGISVINRRSVPDGMAILPSQQFGALPSIAYVVRRASPAGNQAIEALVQQLPTLTSQL